MLEGGIEGRPDNVLFYATSNRRHLMPREMIENERSTAIHPGRGGRGEGLAVRPVRPLARLPPLHAGDLPGHGRALCAHFGLTIEPDRLRREALEWAQTRGARSGRVAWQLIQDVAGRLGVPGDGHAATQTR